MEAVCVGVWVLECDVGRRGELTALNYSFFSVLFLVVVLLLLLVLSLLLDLVAVCFL